jgi:hypothetical protein
LKFRFSFHSVIKAPEWASLQLYTPLISHCFQMSDWLYVLTRLCPRKEFVVPTDSVGYRAGLEVATNRTLFPASSSPQLDSYTDEQFWLVDHKSLRCCFDVAVGTVIFNSKYVAFKLCPHIYNVELPCAESPCAYIFLLSNYNNMQVIWVEDQLGYSRFDQVFI